MRHLLAPSVATLLFAGAALALPARIPVAEAYPAGVAIDGAGGMWIAALQAASAPGSQNALVHLDASGTEIARVPGGTRQELIFDGAGLWAIDFYQELQRLDVDGAATTIIDAGFATGAAWDPASHRMWILQGQDSHEIWIVDATGAVAATLSTEPAHSYWWGLAFDGCSLWTSDIADDTLIRLHPDTGAVLETRDVEARAIEGLAFDGQVLLGSDTTADEIVVVPPGPVTVDGVQCLPQLFTSPPAATFGTEVPGQPAAEGEGEGEDAPVDEAPPSAEQGDGGASGGLVPGDPVEGSADPGSDAAPGAADDDDVGIALPPPLSDDPNAEPGGCACSGSSLPPTLGLATLLGVLGRRRRRAWAAPGGTGLSAPPAT